MKRSFLAILIFSIIAGTGFSQEVKIGKGTLEFGGKVASGVFWDADDVIKETPAGSQINGDYIGKDGHVKMWNESDTKTPLRADLTATYINENIGFRIRLRSDNALEDFDRAVIARYAYGWANLLDNGVKLTGGYIDLSDNVWGTLGDGDWDVSGNGLRLEVKPFKFFNLDEAVAGSLNFGAFLRVPGKDNPNNGRDDEGQVIYRTVNLERTLGETAIGFRYAHPWFYAGAQLQLDSDIDGVDIFAGVGQQISSAARVWSGAGDETSLMFGVGFTMLPRLTLTAEGSFQGLGNWEARGNADLRQTLAYTILDNKLTLGIKAQELLWGYDLKAHVDYPLELTPWMQFKPFVQYKVTPEFIPGLEVGYGFGHLVNGSLLPSTSKNGDTNNKERKFVNEKYDIFIKPNFDCNFSNSFSLKFWYKATFIGFADLGDDPMFADLRQSDSPVDVDNYTRLDSLMKHQVALEFIWTF
ncbi:MAG: hypothetical protein LBS97_06680 [Treponema sp.]|jgi:hypothetical protein|nr:hypothetical protein [Treponema sp.]